MKNKYWWLLQSKSLAWALPLLVATVLFNNGVPLSAQPEEEPQIENSLTQSEEEQEVENNLTPEEEQEIFIIITDKILNQPVFAPFRREATVRDSSRPVYVINRQQIEAQGARTVQEALKYLPGVLSDGTTGGQLGAQSTQIIRGASTSQVLILLDGRPINDVGRFGGFDLSSFTTDNIERIELLPGGGSTLYGSDALGGVINIVTRSGAGETPQVTVRANVGSFGLNEQAIQSRGETNGVSWAVGYTRTQSDNNFPFRIDRIGLESQRENADVLYNNFNLKLAGNLGDRNKLTFSALYLNKEFGVAGGIAVPEAPFNSLTPLARQNTDELFLDLTLESKLGGGDDSLLTTRIFGDFLDYKFENPDGFSAGRDDINRRALGLQVQHNWQLTPNQNITYGYDFRNTQAENNTFSSNSGITTFNYDGSISQQALFASYNVDLTPEFNLNLGIRQDFNSLVNGSFTSPSIGARYHITPTTTVRANYGKSFRSPQIVNLEGLGAFNIVGNPELKPERGNSFDIGIDQQLGDIGLLRFTFFSNRIDNLINFEFGNPSTYTNIGEIKSTGIEADLNVQVAPNFFAFANYTLNDPRIIEDVNPAIEGNELGFRGANSFNLGIAYEKEIYLALILKSLGGYFINNSNTDSLPGYTTVDFKTRIPLSANVNLTGGIDNIFDKQYEQFPGFPALGRNFRVGVNATF
ncbi:TonB-dependent receptor plug domain-containing protein [Cyanobacterium sp. IPPAS B-1200]|uniref:TonB-dependent receptor plug domain-containing protein n=1 Tax=Cyanobacterium sp. IPPAS B-1200 TaxID=1562720 RepID=UPI000AE4CF47|nr:TonB-dependent receptor [Cyanobacterium sp. IPPAS B-1200]